VGSGPVGNDRLGSLQALDIGSSTGIIDNYLAGHLGHVVGIDIDDKAIEFARENFTGDNLEFHIGDAMNLDFPDTSFDVAIFSVIPRPLGHVYVRLFRRADFYYEKHLSYWGLKKLARAFEISDYMVRPGSLKWRVGRMIVKYAM